MTDLTLGRYWRMLQAKDVAVVVEAAAHVEELLAKNVNQEQQKM